MCGTNVKLAPVTVLGVPRPPAAQVARQAITIQVVSVSDAAVDARHALIHLAAASALEAITFQQINASATLAFQIAPLAQVPINA